MGLFVGIREDNDKDRILVLTQAKKCYPAIPESTLSAIYRYVVLRIPTGDFLYGVLTNNLIEACGQADEFNRVALFDIVSFCFNEIPSKCWRTKEAIIEWLNGK